MARSHALERHAKQTLKAILRLVWKCFLLTLWGTLSVGETLCKGLKEGVERINK